MNFSNDDFIRTTEERHKRACTALWQRLVEQGHIYLETYAGWYAVRDEAFYAESELQKAADGSWIARSGYAGRAVGNLRQPNQLATLMVWGLVAATSLLRRWPLLWFSACATLTLAVLASGSRAGIISLVAVAMIGAFVWLRSRHRHDANGRSNGKWHRQPWLAGVLVILLLALLGWAAQHAFSRDTADASLAQRLALWQQTLGLIMQHPWAGVGWAQLNFVWTLTPFADRAPDVFDHAHSLPLHVENSEKCPTNSKTLVGECQ